MPIEIRELVIRTNIIDEPGRLNSGLNHLDADVLEHLRSEVMEICDRKIKEALRKRDGR
jgi:Family of unknown function (DUF5908)